MNGRACEQSRGSADTAEGARPDRKRSGGTHLADENKTGKPAVRKLY